MKKYRHYLLLICLCLVSVGSLFGQWTSLNIIMPDSSECPPFILNVSASDSSSFPIINRAWYLTTCNGTIVSSYTIPGLNPTYTYALDQGCYCIKLVETDSVGHTDSVKNCNITVGTFPVVNFTFADTQGTCPLTVTATCNSIATCGVIDSVFINWGCGANYASNICNGNPINHTYTCICGTGYHNPSISIRNSCGHTCWTTVQYVHGVNVLPQGFGSISAQPLAGCGTLSVNFSDTTSGTFTYSWSFPGGIPSISSQQSPIVIYTNPGYYSCTLIQTDTAGVHDTIVENNYIQVYANPTSNINGYVCSGGQYIFNGQTLTTSGTYYDTLTSFQGCDSFVTLNLQISPTIQISISDTICIGSTFNFGGQNLSTAGVYTDTLVAQGGCDSIVTLNLALTRSISGHVYDGSNNACAIVYLIRQDTVGHLVLVDSIAPFDSASCYGGYVFNNLPVDTYYIKAALQTTDLNYISFLPTYYGNVLHWDSTTAVYDSICQTNININLTQGINPGGAGFVGGWVSQGSGVVLQGQGNGSRSIGSPLPGIQINLLTAAGQAVAYTYTDANGHYQFANLAYGDYKLYAEVLNKVAELIPFTLSAQEPADSSLNLSINSNSATATSIEDMSNISLIGIFPNPTNAACEVRLSCAQATQVELKLSDMLGRTENERSINLVPGSNSVYIDLSAMSAGLYNLSIQNAKMNLIYKVVKAR